MFAYWYVFTHYTALCWYGVATTLRLSACMVLIALCTCRLFEAMRGRNMSETWETPLGGINTIQATELRSVVRCERYMMWHSVHHREKHLGEMRLSQ